MIRAYLAGLQARERYLVLGAAALLVLLLIYLLLWEPFGGKRLQTLQDNVAQQRATLVWMQQAVVRVQQQRGATISPAGGQSLLAFIDQTAQQNQLGSAVKRVEPAGEHSVRVWIEAAPFDTLVAWLEDLSHKNRVFVQSITLDREAGPGRVNARLTLEGGGA